MTTDHENVPDGPKPHPCETDPGQFDHDWQVISDWYGDPEVINGTADCSFLRCRACGEEDHEKPVSEYGADDYDGYEDE